VPREPGLSAAEVYAQLDRTEGWRDRLDPGPLRALVSAIPGAHAALAAALENDLQPAALALRPELADGLDSLRAAGALGALVSGSGPTCFGLFAERAAAEAAAPRIAGAIVTELRRN
ncbi:MAG: 4-(cytidine 5'-diphospho)-2-C-methyl-D-erythritol kinase, partial [Thermoleophilaceae bacterium]